MFLYIKLYVYYYYNINYLNYTLVLLNLFLSAIEYN